MNRVNKTLVIALTSLITLIICLYLIYGILYEKYNENLDIGKFVIENETNRIQYAIDSRLLNLSILEMHIVENNGSVKDFDALAELLYTNDPCVRCIQLAPNGVISYIYPLEGNEAGFGNLFESPKRKKEAIYARDTGNMTLGGPYELHQGGIGVVVRKPIYLYDENDIKRFWGFSIQVMDFTELLNEFRVENLTKTGYDYQLWKYNQNSDKEIISGVDKISENAITAQIAVPGSSWYLTIAPKDGWVPVIYAVMWLLIAMLTTFFVTLIVYYIISTNILNKRLNFLANTDSLTKLYNSRCFYKTVDDIIEKKKPFSLYYIDFDGFKTINDNYGHLIGDKLLVESSKRIVNSVDKDCTVFRMGGDEYTIISYTSENDLCDITFLKLPQTLDL